MSKQVWICLRKPSQKTKGSNARKRLSIFKRTIEDGKKLPDEVLQDDALDAINKLYLKGDITELEAVKNARQVVKNIRKRMGLYYEPIFNNDNLKVFEQYWDKNYKNRDLVDSKTMYNDFIRALRACDNKSLLSSSQQQLQTQLNTFFSGKNENQRRAVSRLNQLLKYVGRDFQLQKLRPEKRRVKHLTPEEFELALAHIADNDIKVLCRVLFYTGCRIGEAFAIESGDILSKALLIDKQVDNDGATRDTKNKKTRHAYFFKEVKTDLKKWPTVKSNIEDLDRTVIAKRFKAACSKAFPDDKSKVCTIHDLRHSYAIHLISKGVSLSLVSQSLGNSVVVCEKYYTCFILTTDAIEYMDKIVKE